MKTINLVVLNLANTSTYNLEGVPEDLITDERGNYCEFKICELFSEQFNEDFHHSSCSWGVYKNSYTQPYKAPSTILLEKRPNSYFFTIGNSKYEYFPKADRLHFQNSNEWTPKGGGLRKLLELFNIQDYE